MQNNNLSVVHSVNAAGPSRVQVGHQYTTNNYHGNTLQHNAKKHLAALRSTDPRQDKARIEQTNGGLLKDSYVWVLENPEFLAWRDADHDGQVLWIRGDPGKGKTMLLCGLIDELQPITRLGDSQNNISLSYFFCQATNSGLNNAAAALRGLIYLLASQQPCLLSHLEDQPEYDATHWNSRIEVEDLFRRVISNPVLQKTYLVVDALDECLDDLSYLLALISSTYSRVRWIVSSRRRCEIDEVLGQLPTKLSLSLELNETSVSQAVDHYIKYRTCQLTKKKTLSTERAQKVQSYLSHNAKGTFLWVALVFQQLESSRTWEIESTLEKFPPGLNSLYKRMIDQIRDSASHELYIRLLAIASTVFRPIEFSELLAIEKSMLEKLGVNEDMIPDIIAECGSFLTTRRNTIVFVHQSAKDFLVRDSSTLLYESGLAQHHYVLFQQSINTLRKLNKDMYGLVHPGAYIDEAVLKYPDADPLHGLEYACVFWVEHLREAYRLCTLSESAEGPLSIDPAHDFIAEKFLFWLEALSLYETLSAASKALMFLKDLPPKVYSEPVHLALIEDAHRFLMLFRPIIEEYPLQVYASGLLFSPRRSLIRERFQEYILDCFANSIEVDDTWSSIWGVFEPEWGIESVNFSSTGQILVISGRRRQKEKQVIIWDPRDSSVRKRTHYSNMRLLEASPDMKWLAAIIKRNSVEELPLRDDILEIRDLYSGSSIWTIQLGNQKALRLNISPNSRFLGICFEEGVEIYDLHTFATGLRQVQSFLLEFNTIEHNEPQLTFSADSTLAAAWNHYWTWVLDCQSGVKYELPCPILSTYISDVKFIPDSNLVVLCTDSAVYIWDFLGERCELSKPLGYPCSSAAFSHAGSWVALVIEQKLMMYDRHDWTLLKEIELPDMNPGDIAVTVALDDQTISLFDDERLCVSSVCELLAREPPSGGYKCLHASNDGKFIACISETEAKLVDATTGDDLSSLLISNIVPESLAFSPRSQHLAFSNGPSIFSWDWKKNVSCRHTKPFAVTGKLAISDAVTTGSNLVAGHDSSCVFVWDITTGKLERSIVSLDERRKHVVDIAFAGSLLGVSWFPMIADNKIDKKTLIIYDIESGQQTCRLESPFPSGIADSSGTLLKMVNWDERLRISPNGKVAIFHSLFHGQFVISDLEANVHIAVVNVPTDNCFFVNDLTISVDGGLFPINSVLAEAKERSTPETGRQVQAESQTVEDLPQLSPVLESYGYQESCGYIDLDGMLLVWIPLQYRPNYTYDSLIITGYHHVTISSLSGLYCIAFKAHALDYLRQAREALEKRAILTD